MRTRARLNNVIGGLFHFSGEYGLAADNVRNFEVNRLLGDGLQCTYSQKVVLADGTLINANAQENNELFWALKGGGPNFGKFLTYSRPLQSELAG